MTEPSPRIGAPECVVALESAAFGLAAAFSLTAVLPVRFPHGPGAAGFPAFYYYREGLELAAFLLTALVVPIAIVAGVHVWSRMSAQLRDRDPELEPGEARTRAAVPFVGLLAVVPSLPLLVGKESLDLGAAAAVALALFAGAWWLTSRHLEPGAAVAAAVGAVAGVTIVPLLGQPSPLAAGLASAGGAGLAALAERKKGRPGAWLLPLALVPFAGGLGLSLVDETVVVARQGPGRGVLLAVVVALVTLAAVMWRRPTRPGRETRITVVAGVLVLAGLSLNLAVDRVDLDTFHEGEWLAAAQSGLQGGLPFRDTELMHGFGYDLLRPLAAFDLFGVDAKAVRLLDAVLVPVSLLAAFAVAARCLGTGGLAAAMLLVVAFGPGLMGLGPRTVVAWAALVPFVLALDRPRRRTAAAAGLAAVLAVLWAFDTGGAVVLGEAAVVVIALIAAPDVRGRLAQGWSAGVAAGLAGALAWMAATGVLGPFLASEGDLLSSFGRAYGRPFLFALETAPEPWLAFFVPVVVVAALAVLLQRVLTGGVGSWELKLATLVAVSGAMFRRALDRSDYAHIELASAFAWLPALMLLGLVVVGRPRRGAAGVLVAMVLILPTPQLLPGHVTLPEMWARLAARPWEDVSGRETIREAPRLGLWVSTEQAQRLRPLLGALDSDVDRGRTVLDFTNNGAVLFLADRANATRYPQIWSASSLTRQDEVVSDLEREKPLVIFRCGSDLDRLDRIDNLVRHQRVAAAINRSASAVEWVGDFLLLATGGDGAPTPTDSPVDGLALGHLAFVWGDAIPGSEALAPWRWDPRRARALDAATGRFEVVGPGPAFAASLAVVDVRPQAVVLNLATVVSTRAALSWSDPALPERQFSVSFEVVGDGQRHAYWVPLENHPGWAWARDVGILALAFEQPPGVVEIGPLRATRLP